jgi:hypothetical protein
VNNILKRALPAFLISTLFLAISCTVFYTDTGLSTDAKSIPEEQTPKIEFQHISLNGAEANTREASVRVHRETGGHGSGAYFLFEGYHVVFTAAHVVLGDRTFIIIDKYGNKRSGTLAYLEKNADFAIILIPAFKKIKPIKFKIPDHKSVKDIGKELIFSGYPGAQSLRTVRALIAGYEGKRFVLHSTAWKGSSGSCVFDSNGNFIGIVYALSMSQFKGHPVLLESMVWVEPYTSIDWVSARRFLKALN